MKRNDARSVWMPAWSTRLLMAAAGLIGAASAFAQVPLSPNLSLTMDGTVYTVIATADGHFIVGGDFTRIAGQPHAHLARLNADGSLDNSWNATADDAVTALATDAANALYVGGCFSHVGSSSRNYLAKVALDTGAVDPNWNPSPDLGCIDALAYDGIGHVYAAGSFTHINGSEHQRIAKLDATGSGTPDASWTAAADNRVFAIAIDGDGAVVVGGDFANIGGQSRLHAARISPNAPGDADSWDPSPDCTVSAIVPDNAGSVYLGGCFIQLHGLFRPFVAKVASDDGTLDPTWGSGPIPDGSVRTLRIAANRLHVGGEFHNIGGGAHAYAARLALTGSGAADAWDPLLDSRHYQGVLAIAANASGNIAIGGTFNKSNSLPRRGLAVVSNAGVLQPAVDATSPGRVEAIVALPAGGAIVGGSFNTAGGVDRNDLLRIKPDGTLDPSWNPDPNGTVFALAARGGSIYVSGLFSRIGGQAVNGLARVSDSGVTDATFTPVVFGSALAVDSTGNVYALLNGGVAKVLPDGSIDPSWTPNPDSSVMSIAIDATDRIYAGGFFQHIGGQAMPYLARLHADGSADTAWAPAANGFVNAIVPDTADNVIVSGAFSQIGGASFFTGVAKLSGSTALADPDWKTPSCPGAHIALDAAQTHVFLTNCYASLIRVTMASPALDTDGWGAQAGVLSSATINAVAADINGNVHVGGLFDALNGVPTLSFATLPATAPALATTERNWLTALYTATNGAAWVAHDHWNGAVGTECTWFGVQCVNGHVIELDLFGNNLDGTLPGLAALTELRAIDVRINALHGSLPALSGPISLIRFQVSGNELSGSIPSISSLVNLVDFEVDQNAFTGTLPSLSGLTGLVTVQAMYNQLSGPIPSLHGLSRLIVFNVNDNQLSGAIPDLGGATSLWTLDLSDNQLSGSIPTVPSATYYNVHGNALGGDLPDFAAMPNLNVFDASRNQLSGSLPDLSGATTLQSIDIGFNHIGGALPAAPPNLLQQASSICPNLFFPYVDDPAWDAATGSTPWYLPCDTIFASGFDEQS